MDGILSTLDATTTSLQEADISGLLNSSEQSETFQKQQISPYVQSSQNIARDSIISLPGKLQRTNSVEFIDDGQVYNLSNSVNDSLINIPEAHSLVDSFFHSNSISDVAEFDSDLPVSQSDEFWFQKKGLNIMHLYIHYLYTKLDEIKILLSQQPNIDILCLCETFLHQEFSDNEINLENYQLFRKDRKTHGGGLVIYVKASLNCLIREDLQVNGIEALWLEVKYENKKHFFWPILTGLLLQTRHG